MTDANALVANVTASALRPVPLDGSSVGQVDHDLVVEWDLDNDGEYFDQEHENITELVRSGSYRVGRDYPSQIGGRSTPGYLRLTLNNAGNRFSNYNTRSPYNSGGRSLKSGRRIRVRVDETIGALAYPNWSGNIVTCGPADDFPTVLATVGNYDIFDVSGDHQADTTLASVGRPMYIRGDGIETTTLPRLATSNPISGLWLSGFTVRRDQELVNTTKYYGIRTSGGAITNFRFWDLKVTGHGLNRGIDLPSSYLNDRGVIHNVLVEEIENVAYWIYCDNLRTWGIEARKLYRQWDVNSGDVDAFRMFGDNHTHSRFWFREIVNAESVSTDNTGSFSDPHTDAVQFYQTTKPGGGNWTLNNCLLEDGIADLPGGDQAITVQSTNVAFNLVDGLTMRGMRMRGISSSVLNVDGVDNFTLENSTIWLDEDYATTQYGLVFGTFWGAGTNPGAVVTGNTLYAQSSNQNLYFSSESVDEGTGNTKVVGDPPAAEQAEWANFETYRPTDLEVEAWLTNGAPTLSLDPRPLLRDRMAGTGDLDGSTSEDGKAWTVQVGGIERAGGAAIASNAIGTSVATVDLGEADYYIQARANHTDRNNRTGLVVRWVDSDNYELIYLRNGSTSTIGLTAAHFAYVGGVGVSSAQFSIENRSDVSIGAHVVGDACTIYVDGVAVGSVTLQTTSSTVAGIYTGWNWQRAPEVTEVMAWSRMRDRIDGVLFTGTVTSLDSERNEDGAKTAILVAEGDLARLDREGGAPSSIGEQTGVSPGMGPGMAIGNILGEVGALHPPFPLDAGDDLLGGFGFDRAKAINLVRRFEEPEIGFVYEPPEGGIRFDSRSARDGSTIVATLSDAPGDGEIAPPFMRVRTSHRDIINRVTSETSPLLPRVRFAFGGQLSTALGVTNNVGLALPSAGGVTEAGDLIIAIIGSSVQSDGVPWLNPPGWTNLRPTFDEPGLARIYCKRLEAGDLGKSVFFYNDTDAAGGAWVIYGWVISQWHGTVASGVSIAGPVGYGDTTAATAQVGTNDPPAMLTPWERSPTLYIAGNVGVSASSGPVLHATAEDEWAPDGFQDLRLVSVDAGAGAAYDAAIRTALLNSSEAVVNPSGFTGNFDGFDFLDAFTLAIRPFAGDPPPISGGPEVQANNVESQHEHGVVVEHRGASGILADEAAADSYNDSLLTRYDVDRPIVRARWKANASDLHRYLARTIRLSDKLHVTDSDEGVDGEFYVETVAGDFSADRGWDITVDCSPALDSGNGADDNESIIPSDDPEVDPLAIAAASDWIYTVGNSPVTNPDPGGAGTILAIAIGQGTTNAPTITITAPSATGVTELTGLAVTGADIRQRVWYYTNDGANQTFGYSGGSDNRTTAVLIALDGEATSVIEGGTPIVDNGPVVSFPSVTVEADDLVIPFAGRRDNNDTPASLTGYSVVSDDTADGDNPQGVAWQATAATAGTETPADVTWSDSAGVHVHSVVAFRGEGSGTGIFPTAARINNADLTIDLDATDSSTWDNNRSEGQWQIGGGVWNPGADDSFGTNTWEADDETILTEVAFGNLEDGTDEILQADTYGGVDVVYTARQYEVDGSYLTPAEAGNNHGSVDSPPSFDLYFDGTRATMTHSAIPQSVGGSAETMVVGLSFVVEPWMYAGDWTSGPWSLHSPTIYHTGPIGSTFQNGQIYLSGKYSETDIDPDSTTNIVGGWASAGVDLPAVGEWYTMVVEFLVDPGGDGFWNWWNLDQDTGEMTLQASGGNDFGWKFDEGDGGYTDENDNFYFNLPSEYEFHQYTPSGITENWDAAGATTAGATSPNLRLFRWAHATAAQGANVGASEMVGHAKFFLGVS